MEATGADVSVDLRAGRSSPRPPSIEAIDAGIPLAVVITEGVAVKDTAEFYNYAKEQGHDADHRPELPRPHHARASQRRHHPGRHLRHRPHRPGLASRAR